MRKKIFDIVENRSRSKFGKIYSGAMFVFIFLSLVPLMFRDDHFLFWILECVCVAVFVLDYAMRWLTADFFLAKGKWGKWAFAVYPFTPMAVVDLLSILPLFVGGMNNAFFACRATRLLRIFRFFKIVHYSGELRLLLFVLRRQKKILLSIFGITALYIFFIALVMFNIGNQFRDFFEALYWATHTLTTVGYGDVYPGRDCELGRFFSMISSLVGVMIIALPSSVITASYMNALEKFKKHKGK